ncbi:hypothetical protein [Mycolicibacterium moriokaense]|uniref:Uncharacterized protein n=1 Tax=Mycolicibacterium moriokaense TaxID=39691 RepID=A0AAD1HIF6_9MYCO|nr:hypothetical protein [Mycolicibacterium moriokaense]MCV7038944.1 hypothetical protein [Mycolicibacterium moriokaense]BBX04673.1 hypothetical protein MMOR_56090 [Mycolicibacterium moriokaense]
MPVSNPKDLAGTIWSLLHGVSTLTIGRHLTNVGIREDAEAITERALRQMLI